MTENGDNEKLAALEAKICHQIEYDFGDFNLPWDKFVKEQIKLDEGWVPLEIMIKFNRLSFLTTDLNVIVEALSKSKAELMEISEDKTKIRRSPNKPLSEVYKNNVKNAHMADPVKAGWQLAPLAVPTESDKTLLVQEQSSGPSAGALLRILFTAFSQFGFCTQTGFSQIPQWPTLDHFYAIQMYSGSAPGLPQVQPEAQTRNSKPTKVQSSLPQEEVKGQLSQPLKEAEPSITQQDAYPQYELGTENIGQLSMQEANAPSGSRHEAQHSNMAFVTVRPVDMKVTTSAEAKVSKSTEAGKKPQPTSSQLQTLTQHPESPEEEEPSSTQQKILSQTSELSEEIGISSTHQEAPAQPLGPLVEAELSATKTKPAQLSESFRTEEPSEIQLKAPDQPSDLETGELETSPTQLKQPAQFSEHGKERVPTPHHHKAKHPHLTHVTGKPLNLQLAITPEPTTEEGNFPVLPKAAAQPSTPVNDVKPSISQQGAPNLFSEASERAELLQFHQEAPATSSELAQQETQAGNLYTFEEGEPSWPTQEAGAQPPELPNELIPEPPELQEKTVSPLGDEQVQPPTLTRGAVTPGELLSSEVEIEISTAQEAPAQSSVSLEQFESLGDNQEHTTPQPNPAIKDELSSFVSKVPTPPAELAGEYSPDHPQSLAMSPGSSGVPVSPVQQELAAQSSGLPRKVTLSLLLTGRVTFSAQPSEPPEDTEPFSVPQEEDAAPLSEPPNEMEPSQAQKMTPPQRAEEEEPSPAPPPAASPPPDPPKVELSSTLPLQLPSEPPNESAAHPPPRSETTVPTPAQGQAQQPRGAFHPLNLEATIIPERTTDGEFSTALKNATALPLKHHKVTLPPPDWVQTQHSKLSLLTVRPLHRKLIGAPGITAKVRSFPTMPEIPSQPPKPPKVVQTPASHEVQVVTPGLELAQHPTSPTVTDQALNLELTTAVLTIETQVSVPLQEAASPPPEQPEVILTQPEQLQAQHPNLAEVTVQPLDVEFVVTEYSNIIMMTLALKTLIIPRHMACCLCQFKSDIEVVGKTVKLHCDSECVTNPMQCLEKDPVGNPEGAFMRVLQARKMNTKTELVIESGKSSSEQSDVSWSDFMDKELDSKDENDVVGALNYILPNFSEVNLEDVDSLLPFIQLLFSNIQNEANPQGYMKGNMKNPSHQPVSSSMAYRNELKKLYLLQSWLRAEIQRKIEEVKKKEKTGMLMQSSLSSPKFQIVPDVPKKLASAEARENSLVEDQHEGRRLRTVHRVLKGPKGIRKRLLKERQKQVVREKQSTQPLAENTADGRSLRSPSTGKPGQNEGVLGPGNLLHTEQKVPVSSALQDPLLGRLATSTLAKAPHGVRHGAKDLTNSIRVLENPNVKVKSMKASKTGHGFQTVASLKAHRTLKANPRKQLMKEDAHGRLKIVEGPLFSALRSLIHSRSQGLLSSSGDPRIQDHPFPELYDLANTSTGSTAVEDQTSENISEQNAFTINSPVSPKDSALTLISTDDHTNERHRENTSTGTEPPPPETSVPLLSSPEDELETQLDQQLYILLPNKELRTLISDIIHILSVDCSEPSMHLACAKLISRICLLMKLLSAQQEEVVAQRQRDKKQWKNKTYINKSSRTSTKTLISSTSIMVALTLLIFIFYLIKICSHRRALGKDKERSSSSVSGQKREYSAEKDSQKGFSWFWHPLWHRYMSSPLSVTQEQSMGQEVHEDVFQ
ncbi:Leucine-rich repeat-containing protein 37A [Heterocephalus glaber]|uniref:Leucine-rich repeat-containing protein 37A n=1 Tax=Heterocephalus glaber TaxID=10181 RepID=G5BQI1_HETGA|nr:Leucine-rich repeat-containing protein 37A [Heterocephalus glaber]